MKKIIFLAFAATALFTSCKKDHDDYSKAGIFKGPEVQVYHGLAWSWTQLDAEGNPERIAISIDDAALNSVKIGTDTANPGTHQHEHENNEVLKFDSRAQNILFKHIWLNWNPNGHEPEQIYGKPHFDLHFYMNESLERETFTDPVKMEVEPAADYLPANHISPGPGVPTMGKHWVDVTSPELNPVNPQPFTQTFIYGSYDGKMAFYEPMITLEFLKNTTNFERPIPQPAKFRKSGYYPTKMRITKQNGVTNIILDGMVYRTPS